MRPYDKKNAEHEEALFALLMDELMQTEGNAFLDENEYLKETIDADVMAKIDKRSMETIQEQFENKSSPSKLHKMKFLYRHTMAAVITVVCLFGLSYLTMPTVKAKTLNLLMDITDKATEQLIMTDSSGSDSSPNQEYAEDNFGYVFNYIPCGFYYESESQTKQCVVHKFKNDKGSSISIQIINGVGNVLSSVDTENVSLVENISIDGGKGLLIEKNGKIQIAIVDLIRDISISIIGDGIEKSSMLAIAQNIEFRK